MRLAKGIGTIGLIGDLELGAMNFNLIDEEVDFVLVPLDGVGVEFFIELFEVFMPAIIFTCLAD